MDDVNFKMTSKCGWCAGLHEGTVCPMVKAIEYHENGTLKRVEFKTPADYAPMQPQPYYQPYQPYQPSWPYAPYYPVTVGAR